MKIFSKCKVKGSFPKSKIKSLSLKGYGMKYSVLFTALLSVNDGNVTLKKIPYICMKNISQYFNHKKGFSDIIVVIF